MMHLVLAKVDDVLFEGEVRSVTVPGAAGEMTVLGHHEPLISTLKAGEVRVHLQDGGSKAFQVGGGVLEVRADGATILL